MTGEDHSSGYLQPFGLSLERRSRRSISDDRKHRVRVDAQDVGSGTHKDTNPFLHAQPRNDANGKVTIR